MIVCALRVVGLVTRKMQKKTGYIDGSISCSGLLLLELLLHDRIGVTVSNSFDESQAVLSYATCYFQSNLKYAEKSRPTKRPQGHKLSTSVSLSVAPSHISRPENVEKKKGIPISHMPIGRNFRLYKLLRL